MEETVAIKKRPFISLRARILLGLILLFVVIFVGAFFWFYKLSINNALDQLKQVHKGLIEAVLADYPVEGFTQLKTMDAKAMTLDKLGYPDDPLYKADADWLYKAYLIKRRAYLYTFYIEQQNVVYMTTMAGPKGSKNGVKFKQTADVTPNHIPCQDGLFYRNNYQVYRDEFGAWLSACAPIKNGSGQLVGVLGSDFKNVYVADMETNISKGIVVAGGVSLIIVILAIYVITTAITRPIMVMKQATTLVAAGNYDINLNPVLNRKLADEISVMAQAFDGMVQEVKNREESLRKQVAALTIAIDDAMRKAQLSEIVETEFFRGLKDRSSELRRRKQTGLKPGHGEVTPGSKLAES